MNIGTGEVWLYSYDNANRMVEAQHKPSSTGAVDQQVNYAYDVLGNRIEESVSVNGGAPTVTKFAYDQNGNAWADLNAGGALVTRRIYANAVDALVARIDSNGVAWYLTDNLGSVRDITNSSGVLIDHRDYDSFGTITNETNPSAGDRYGFTSREFDVYTGLQYNRARYYDASTGRWMSQDPMGFAAGDSDLYRYVGNQPTGGTDPSGYIWSWPAAGVGAGIGAAIGAGISISGDIFAGREISWRNAGAAAAGGATAGFIAGGLAGAFTGDPTAVIAGGILVGGLSGGAGAFVQSATGQLANNRRIDAGQLFRDTAVGTVAGGITGGALAGVGTIVARAANTNFGRSVVLSGAMRANELGMSGPTAQQIARALRNSGRAVRVRPGQIPILPATQVIGDAVPGTPTLPAPGRLIGSTEGLNGPERAFAHELVGQGHTVEVVDTGESRTPDFIVNGVRTELKTLSGVAEQTSNGLSGAIANRVMNGRGQAARIIVDARGQAGMTIEIAERGIRRAYGADNATGSRIQSIRVIGDEFDVTIPRAN